VSAVSPSSSCLTVDATVLAADGGFVDVELDAASRCAGCSGTCMWGRGRQTPVARLRTGAVLAPGDRVRVSLPAGALMRSTLLLHGLPLAALLAGGALGAWVTQSDLGCLAGALASLGLALYVVAPRLRQRVESLTVARVVVVPLR
jgi:sigma-E factor negative regulatory protein RseC